MPEVYRRVRVGTASVRSQLATARREGSDRRGHLAEYMDTGVRISLAQESVLGLSALSVDSGRLRPQGGPPILSESVPDQLL